MPASQAKLFEIRSSGIKKRCCRPTSALVDTELRRLPHGQPNSVDESRSHELNTAQLAVHASSSAVLIRSTMISIAFGRGGVERHLSAATHSQSGDSQRRSLSLNARRILPRAEQILKDASAFGRPTGGCPLTPSCASSAPSRIVEALFRIHAKASGRTQPMKIENALLKRKKQSTRLHHHRHRGLVQARVGQDAGVDRGDRGAPTGEQRPAGVQGVGAAEAHRRRKAPQGET